ncbi:hypothetical protein OKW34_003645 [Paraburkholderia youngii]|uniref:hypothetical protein n=1 Tax=Paraburkholderia youngii TaxID=2782701 RepID=UPI003D19BF7C
MIDEMDLGRIDKNACGRVAHRRVIFPATFPELPCFLPAPAHRKTPLKNIGKLREDLG